MWKEIKIIFILLLFSKLFYAQKADFNKINVNTIETTTLENLIIAKIDSVRKTKKLNLLVFDSILSRASKDHADYLNKTKRLSHFQNIPTKKNPSDRVLFYKGRFDAIAENIAKSFLNKALKNKSGHIFYTNSLEEIANEIVDGWVHSPDHYKNMISPIYTHQGLSISIDYKKEEIYVVQVFIKK